MYTISAKLSNYSYQFLKNVFKKIYIYITRKKVETILPAIIHSCTQHVYFFYNLHLNPVNFSPNNYIFSDASRNPFCMKSGLTPEAYCSSPSQHLEMSTSTRFPLYTKQLEQLSAKERCDAFIAHICHETRDNWGNWDRVDLSITFSSL